jgi:hypothetical protein
MVPKFQAHLPFSLCARVCAGARAYVSPKSLELWNRAKCPARSKAYRFQAGSKRAPFGTAVATGSQASNIPAGSTGQGMNKNNARAMPTGQGVENA